MAEGKQQECYSIYRSMVVAVEWVFDEWYLFAEQSEQSKASCVIYSDMSIPCLFKETGLFSLRNWVMIL